ncbi:uncharacterized protein LOC129907755 [Episyrphus balteatus]|uniref:uncharacterized protein LOC129907755 n=1 Tax=Episyrphus balteatus TaxID=286459 RepID=UPI00248531F4|nr:uncharacterized protein LOC129907755 [Episyrphus balteatus]
MSNWNRIQTTHLIMLYEQHPVLYNSQCEDALNRIKKVDAFKSITEELKIYRPESTLEDIKTKIKTLRNQYIRERNAVYKSKKSGAGVQDVYTPKLWCYDELNFLDQFLKSTPSVSNITQKNPFNHEESLGDDTLENEPEQECKKKKKKTGLEVHITRSLQVAEESRKNPPCETQKIHFQH